MPLFLVPFLLFFFKTDGNPFFLQERVGQHGDLFTIYKLQTMKDSKVTSVGSFLRKSKLDELPQLINILKGDMSFVGPRPDVPGYYDKLEGDDRKVLQLKPGITSMAAIKYRDEEFILSLQDDPLVYNDKVLFPDKVRMNLEYLEKQSFWLDVKILWLTALSVIK
nr:sugar transferase [Nonlabens ponticola]